MPQIGFLPRASAFIDGDIAPLSVLRFFRTATSTSQAVYTDAALTVSVLTLTADSDGVFSKWFLNPDAAYDYRYTLETAAGVQYWAENDIPRRPFTQSEVGAILYPQTAAELAAGVTPTNYAYGEGNGLRYGMVGNDSTDNTAALARLRSVAAQGVSCFIPEGTYRYTTSPNWGIEELDLRGTIGTILKHTGVGIAFDIDSGSGGAYLDGLNISDLVIYGGASTTDAFRSRGAVRSTFKRIEVRNGCTGKAFNIMFAVSCHFDTCIVSSNPAPINVVPAYGFYLDHNSAGYDTCDSTFTNCIAEGFAGTGCKVVHGQGNAFIGGTFEHLSLGLDIDATSYRNAFHGIWFEGNTNQDVIDRGTMDQFVNCHSISVTLGDSVDVRGQGAVFIGGYLRWIDLDAASRNTLLLGVSVSNNVSIGITGAGTYKQLACSEADNTEAIVTTLPDVFGSRGSFTGTLTGCTTSPTGTITWSRIGDTVTLDFGNGISGTSNSTGATITGMPAELIPASGERVALGVIKDNGTKQLGVIDVNASGVITLGVGAAFASFTNVGTKGVERCSVTYKVTS